MKNDDFIQCRETYTLVGQEERLSEDAVDINGINHKKENEMTQTKLENWSVTGDAWAGTVNLVGNVYDHPNKERHYDGKRIKTSYITKINKKEITTHSGTIYYLGEPEVEYVEWMKENNILFDPENPIRDLRKN